MGWFAAALAGAWLGCGTGDALKGAIRPDPAADASAPLEDGGAPVSAEDAGRDSDGDAAAPGPTPGGGATYDEACAATADGFGFAQHAFPGKTAVQLSKVRVIYPLDQTAAKYYPGFTRGSSLPAVRDGAAGAFCSKPGISVTFVEPDTW